MCTNKCTQTMEILLSRSFVKVFVLTGRGLTLTALFCDYLCVSSIMPQGPCLIPWHILHIQVLFKWMNGQKNSEWECKGAVKPVQAAAGSRAGKERVMAEPNHSPRCTMVIYSFSYSPLLVCERLQGEKCTSSVGTPPVACEVKSSSRHRGDGWWVALLKNER